MPRSLPALLLLLAAGLPEPLPVHAQTFIFTGRVVHLSQRLPPGVRLRLVGRGEADVLDSGLFRFELPADATEVTVELLHPELEVVYPPEGRVNTPADRSRLTVIVVGEPVEQAITNALADRTRVLEQRLQENGVQFDALQGTLEEGIRRILEKLDVREEELRAAIEAQDRRAQHLPLIAEAVNGYVLEAKDLRDLFDVIGAMDAEHASVIPRMQEAVLAYNTAFEALHNNQEAFETYLRTYWNDDELLDDLKRFFALALGEIHRDRILTLNEQLVEIQLQVGRDRVDRTRLRGAIEEIARIVRELAPRLQRLELEAQQLLEALSRR